VCECLTARLQRATVPFVRYLIVDGHSVIFAWPELRRLHGRRTALARDELIKRLTGYQDASGVRVVLVFDGKGEALSEETQEGGIQVFYSRAGQTADDVVERLVAKYGTEHELTVATSDLMERRTAVSFGATTVSAENLRAVLEEAEGEMNREIKKRRRKGR
jgi:predicted RNA-binding protein with PIN domain